MALNHVLLKNPRLRGWEYGMLRAFEEEIVQQTQARTVDVPDYGTNMLTARMGHSMRFDPLRKYLPKKPFPVDADVLWYILMGPENYELDLFTGWDSKARYRIVYIYDTLEPQFKVIEKIFSDDRFNICITSFNDAVPFLDKLTGKSWQFVEQAVPTSLFHEVKPEERVIPFSSYGRRLPSFHKALQEFCQVNNLYYDFTTHNATNPTAPENELYTQYAWHISHSEFTVSWPVEITNPVRAGQLRPITCRWFEAAAAGTVIIGQQPGNPGFNSQLTDDLVVNIDPNANHQEIWKRLDWLYANKETLLKKSSDISQKKYKPVDLENPRT